jgi:hypothetical protein
LKPGSAGSRTGARKPCAPARQSDCFSSAQPEYGWVAFS